MSNGAAAGAAAAAATANAIKASGAIVRMSPEDFKAILRRAHDPLVVRARGGFLYRDHCYLLSYKGLTFFTRSREPIYLPSGAEVVQASRIWMPR